MQYPKAKVAVAHLAPVFLDPAATVDIAISAVKEAAAHGAELIAFPESFVPGFPLWAAIHAPIRTHEHFKAFAAASIYADGPEMARLRHAARRYGIMVSIGISERNHASVGGLWNSNILIGTDGSVLNHHRKLVPTFFEKLAWNPGDGAGLRVVETAIGRVGALICGENTNPLARYALIAQGEQVHISSYPPAWPTRPPAEAGNFDNRSANRIRASAHCFEAKCFGVVAAGLLDDNARDILAAGDMAAREILDEAQLAPSFFLDPAGNLIGEEQFDQGIAYAVLDISACVEPKRFHDVVAGYNRFDIFDVQVARHRQGPITFKDLGRDEPAAPLLDAEAAELDEAHG